LNDSDFVLKQALAAERDMRLEESEQLLLEASRRDPAVSILSALARVQ
jgi:hypothetical protein